MNYLITGGTGLIGYHLIGKLIQNKRNCVTVLTRNVNKAVKLLDERVNVINRLSLENIEEADIIINLAGEAIADKRWSRKQKNKICHSRWLLTQQIVSLIEKAKSPPNLLISGSAIGIYGRQSNQPITEEFKDYHEEFSSTVCQRWEKIASKASARTRVALLRTGIVLAKEQGALAKMSLPFRIGLGGKIAQGEQIMSWIHIEDMVNAIIHIIENQTLHGAINITSEKTVTNKQFSFILANTLNRPCLFTTPSFLLKLMFGEMADLLLYGQNVQPKKLKMSNFKFKYENLDIALKSLLNG
ncbi:TIGR01777 family oxidoreductase [Litorilituus lipolyticus]|uniref:TIGR01777 family protein n=1 Tax=Litorilituus lipolyticus TaxID=2491017 RepID=A0A502KKK1_9GAMM|nr:TIGR01777 family oxidoreductase [Litorilituus lipolyticus]TPH12092.1 TIGR01777 family protein [Litorilituus lipolyticus]